MLGRVMNKNEFNQDDYTALVEWCDSNNAHIEDKGDYYEVVENTITMPTVEERIEAVDAQYSEDKKELINYFVEFLIENNAEGQQAVREEMALLDAQYDADIEALNTEGGI